MSLTQELTSWFVAGTVQTGAVPTVGSKAPSLLPGSTLPRSDKKPLIITFLRHCGCPFAEKVFVSLRKLAQDNPDVHCVAVSHSDESATDKWADAVGGGGHIEVIVDHDRKLYGAYGLGISSLWHVLSPWSMADVFSLGRSEGIGVRPTESGTRWQTAGTFGVDSEGIIRYAHVAEQASDMTGLAEALSAVKPIKAG